MAVVDVPPHAQPDPAEVRRRLEEQGVRFLLSSFVELAGVPKAKLVPIAHWEDVARDGAGLDGIEKGLDAGSLNERNMYEVSKEVLRREGIAVLPATLKDAVDALEADEVIRAALGDEYAQTYISAKRGVGGVPQRRLAVGDRPLRRSVLAGHAGPGSSGRARCMGRPAGK